MFLGDYADVPRGHIKSFGTTKHRLATVSQKNGAHAVHNRLAHYREAISVDEILSARSIVEALTTYVRASDRRRSRSDREQ